MSDWTAFGRVDAEGTVYVKTADGERVVGSWQAGSPEEGLAHFARRFADVVTEVDLVEARLGSGAADAAHSLATIRRIRASLRRGTRRRRHRRPDRAPRQAGRVAEAKAGEARAARETARAEALVRKTPLVEEAEKIAAESTGWKSAGDRLKEILDEWKTIRGVDKKSDGELWKRFAAARDGFTRRRGAHFATLDSQRKQAQTAKEELVTEAETLRESTDWGPTAARLKDLMTRVEGGAARLEGGRAAPLGEVPRRAGRLLHQPQRRLLGPRRRAAAATSIASRRCSPRPSRSTSTPTRGPRRPSSARSRASGTTPAACRATTPPSSTGACARWRRRSGSRWTPRGAAPSRPPTRC